MESIIGRVYNEIFKIWRKKRHLAFVKTMAESGAGGGVGRLLDVGGYPGFWTGHEPVAESIECLNVHPVEWDPETAPAYKIRTRIGNGCAMPEFAEAEFDVVFSNSVIEHVGSWVDQQAFAAEVRRVGRRLWVQTPAYECPIEPHYMAPLVHYLPRGMQRRVLRWLSPWGWLARPTQAQVDEMVATTRLLSKREVVALFPDCEIRTERMLWVIPKSYIAVRL